MWKSMPDVLSEALPDVFPPPAGLPSVWEALAGIRDLNDKT